MAFDILYLDRRDLTGRPLRDRRFRLEDVVAGSELVFRCGGSRRMAWRRGGR
jgi:ATP-dependent DNA ligase